MTPKTRRPGVAAVWALVVLSVVSAVSAVAVGRFAAARRQADAYRNRLQAEWLARSGYELAVAKLATDPTGYTGETATPIPGGEVTITVSKDSAAGGAVRVESVARFPVGGRVTVSRTVQRTVKPPAKP